MTILFGNAIFVPAIKRPTFQHFALIISGSVTLDFPEVNYSFSML